MKIARWLLGIVATTALVGCNAVSVVKNYQSGMFDSGEYNTDAQRGDMPLAVTGGAFGLDPNTLADVTARNMQGADWPPHAHFTTTPGLHSALIYHYVMMWNGPRDVTVSDLCANPEQLRPAVANAGSGGDVVLVAGLCRHAAAATGATVVASRVTGPGDAKFRQMIVTGVQVLTANQPGIFTDGGGRGMRGR